MTSKDVYCHFSFRRMKDTDYGIFAVAFYLDYDGTNYLGRSVKVEKLWENHQYITSAQSMRFALQCIYEIQNALINKGVKNVYLVTDNTTLASWVTSNKKSQMAKVQMARVWQDFRAHEKKELTINVGLAKVRKTEKSYKYCKLENAENKHELEEAQEVREVKYKVDLGNNHRSILDMLEEEVPKFEGVGEV